MSPLGEKTFYTWNLTGLCYRLQNLQHSNFPNNCNLGGEDKKKSISLAQEWKEVIAFLSIIKAVDLKQLQNGLWRHIFSLERYEIRSEWKLSLITESFVAPVCITEILYVIDYMKHIRCIQLAHAHTHTHIDYVRLCPEFKNRACV